MASTLVAMAANLIAPGQPGHTPYAMDMDQLARTILLYGLHPELLLCMHIGLNDTAFPESCY